MLVSLSACQPGTASTKNPTAQPDFLDTRATVETPITADLSADSLTPPEPVNMTISSSSGLLSLTWDAIKDQRISRVYLYDPLIDAEALLSASNDATQNTYSLASSSHQRAWHRELLRVELCNTDNCISSKRLSIADAIEPTIQRITPSVFIEGERFAESISINNNTKMMAVALPEQGAIDVYIKPANNWLVSQRIALNNLSLSASRKIHIDVSATGDTIAVFVHPANNVDSPNIRILQRLGEGWFETNTISLREISDSAPTNNRIYHDNPIVISNDASRILLSIGNQAYTLVQTPSGWTKPALLEHSSVQVWDNSFNSRFINESYLKAMSASGSLDRIFVAHAIDQTLWLSVWQFQTPSMAVPTWKKVTAYPISAISPNDELLIRSNNEGTQIFIAGWEATQTTDRTPVAWRYELASSNEGALKTSLSPIDSIRFPPTIDTSASIRFSTVSTLNQVILGWQSTNIDSTSPKAALINYVYNEGAMRWIPKLELPNVYPTFAMQASVRSVNLSPDGSTLMLSVAASNFQYSENRVGELLSFY